MSAPRRVALLAAVLAASVARADPQPVQLSTSGLFIQRFVHQQMMYVVDAGARLCYVKAIGENGGVTRIPCQRLRQRAGWDQVIGWEED